MTIVNNTQKTIRIYNQHFCVDLSTGKSIDINTNDLKNDFMMYFQYSDYSKEWREIDYGLEHGGLSQRTYLKYENQSVFPVVSILNIENVSKLTLICDDVALRKLLLFKTVRLKRIAFKFDGEGYCATQYKFLNEEDRVRFLRLMRFGCLITCPAAFLALILVVDAVLSNETFIDKLIVVFFLVGLMIVAAEDLYYMLKAKKWEVINKSELK